MKRLKFCVVMAALLITSVLLGGCWNYNDVDTQFVVMGVVVDKDEDEYVIYAEVAKAKGGAEAELVTRVESFRGKTLFDATRNGILKIGSKIYWGHTMVYIISEKVANEGLAQVLSLISRQTQIRSDIFIIICDDASVEKIFTFEDMIHPDVSEHLHDLINNHEASAKLRRTPLFKILQELASREVSLMLPVIKMQPSESAQMDESASSGKDVKPGDEEMAEQDQSASDQSEKPAGEQQQEKTPEESQKPSDKDKEQEKPSEEGEKQDSEDKKQQKTSEDEKSDGDKKKEEEQDSSGKSESSGAGEDQSKEIIITDGSAIFVKDKMVGRLTDSETRSALILKQEIQRNYVLATDASDEAPACAIEVIDSKLSITPNTTSQNTLLFDIELNIEGDLVEILSQVDYITDEKKHVLEESFENMLERELLALIRKAQDAGSDICGFAGITHRNLPSFWKRMPSVWDDVYKQATFTVSVQVDITSSSLSMNPIKVGR